MEIDMEIVHEDDFLNTYKLKKFGYRALENYGHLFPIKTSPELSSIVPDLVTDGHLQIRQITSTCIKYEYFGFFSSSVNDLEKFSNKMFSVFGVRGEIRPWDI